jgi:hypothetical protein
MAPEFEAVYKNRIKIGNLNYEKCDVYSLGLTLIQDYLGDVSLEVLRSFKDSINGE